MSAKTIDDGGPVHSLSVHPAHGYGASASVEQGETRRQALARGFACELLAHQKTYRETFTGDKHWRDELIADAHKLADMMLAFEARERAEMEQKK